MKHSNLYRWLINISDRVDIFITAHWNLRPKQRMLEWQMDNIRDPYIETKIQEALDNDDPKETPRFSRHAK